MDAGDIFLKLLADASGLRRDVETKSKAETAGLSTSVTVKVDDKGSVKAFTSKMDAATKATESTSSSVSGLASGAMPALIAGGAALSPIITTLGVGLGGLALAAVGVAKPISDAAGKAGGLRANMAALNPEQQAVAKSLLGLQKAYSGFEKSLSPVILGDFNGGLRIAKTLLGDVRPVAAATGKALGGVLNAVDAEFRSSEWRSFFGWMAATAGPDVRLLGQDFVGLMQVLPPLVQALQPVATTLTKIVGGGVQTIRVVNAIVQKIAQSKPSGQENIFQKIGDGLDWLQNHAPAGHKSMGQLIEDALGMSNASATAGKAMGAAGVKGKTAAGQLALMVTAVTNLMNAENKSLSTQTSYAGDLVTSANDAVSLRKALKASHDIIGLHTAAQRNSFGAANTYINDLGKQATGAIAAGKGVNGAIKAISDGLPILDQAKTKNHAYWTEVKQLHDWLVKLQNLKAIHESVFITGNGTFTIRPGTKLGLPGGSAGGPFAAGGPIYGPGTRTSDSIPIMASRDEWVIKASSASKYGSKAMAAVNAGSATIGFADGGQVGSYVGSVAGLVPWSRRELNAAVRADAMAIGRATFAAMKAASQGAPAIVADAMRWIGKIPYVWGGTAVPGGADCSGFTSTIYSRHGIHSVPRTSEAQGAWVRKGPPIPGGLAFYNSPAGGPPPGHVAIVGNRGMVISQGGGMGPQYVPLRSMDLMFTGVPPGGFASGGPVRSYDAKAGSWMPPGLSLSYNGTGDWEHLTPDRGRPGDVTDRLDRLTDRLDQLIGAVNRAPGKTATGVADALTRAGRRPNYSATYGAGG